jgi:hypothetical protein
MGFATIEKINFPTKVLMKPDGQDHWSSDTIPGNIETHTNYETNYVLSLELNPDSSIKFAGTPPCSKIDYPVTSQTGSGVVPISCQFESNSKPNVSIIEMTVHTKDFSTPPVGDKSSHIMELITNQSFISRFISKLKGRFSLFFFVMVTLLLLTNSCSKLENPADISQNDIVSIQRIGSEEVRADGISPVSFKVAIAQDSDTRVVTLKTSNGSFIGSLDSQSLNLTVDSKGQVECTMKIGTKAELTTVTATIKDWSAYVQFDTLWAYPDRIVGETSSGIVKCDGSVKATLSAILSRTTGVVSLETPVDFFAFQNNGQNQPIAVGRFSDWEKSKTNAEGIAAVVFSADTGDVEAGKPVLIRMVTKKDDGSTIQFELSLQVK